MTGDSSRERRGERREITCVRLRLLCAGRFFLLSFFLPGLGMTPKVRAQNSECPPTEAIPGCPCYNFEDGIFLECPGATEDTLRNTMIGVMSEGGAATMVQSLSVYELDKSIVELKEGYFPVGSQIRHLQISHSSLREISENAFAVLKKNLESLALVSGHLPQVPQKSLTELEKLAALDLEGNLIQDLSSYCFWGLKLIKLSLKANEISKISEHTFAGLEDSLTDLDLTENKLLKFPITALRRLESLASLRLGWNEISQLPDDGYSKLNSLLILDLSSNNFEKLDNDCFRPCPILNTISLYYNSIEIVHKDAFISLTGLESIDLSHNKIVFLDLTTFKNNVRLRTIELSHNHIHYIGRVFSNLPELRELYLAENNILEIPGQAFFGSTSLAVVYLQQNAIRRLDARAFTGLSQLAQLHLTNNYIEIVPIQLFVNCCENLLTLSLDGNKIRNIESRTFLKLDQLRELRLQNNHITEILTGVFAKLPSLLELHLQNNAITHIETGALTTLNALQHVNLQGNQLTILGDVFELSSDSDKTGIGSSSATANGNAGGSSLVSIQLDSNKIHVLNNDSLKGQTSVRIMWLGHNKLTHLQARLFRDLLLVERLYLTNNSISTIEDNAFEPMQALKYLQLSMNKLQHVTIKTFSELDKLEELYLQNNGLRKLDPYAFTSLDKLRILDLANNNLTVIDETMFQQKLPIEKLNLSNCSIINIKIDAFRGLDNLVDFNIEDNKINTDAFEQFKFVSLKKLTASGNKLNKLIDSSLNGLPLLQHLILENSEITEIPETIFTLNPNLARLNLKRNLLQQLPYRIFSTLKSLREIRLDKNFFFEIPYKALTYGYNVEILSMSYNNIINVNAANLTALTNLKELDLSNNKIETMTGFAIANITRLISVNLSHNNLKALPVNFFVKSTMLRSVDLSDNKFIKIPAVSLSGQNLPGLMWLNITKNPLNHIYDFPSEALYPVLHEIHICRTNITIVTSQDFEAFPSLLHLFLTHNGIRRISPGAFKNLPNLLTLHLGMNNIEILPKERLHGMDHLRILNLTQNRLKELDEFPIGLKSLQILDLSYNQIGIVGKITFNNLVNLVELHLYGNWINSISSEAFRPLKKLRLLDLSRNYLENLPLNAFRPLETQIRSLRAEENPLHCGCESQELWEWLRDHQKVVGAIGGNRGGIKNSGTRVSDLETGLLRCEQPPELRGLVFLDLDPHAFCSIPLVIKLAIQDIQPFSVLVSWQSRNHSGLHGYQVAYHALDNVDEVREKLLDPRARSVRLSKLASDTRYLICVLGLGSWETPISDKFNSLMSNASQDDVIKDSLPPVMVNSLMSRCTEVRTLDSPDSVIGEGTMADSILTRRLGLIVGICMGFVVFVVLVTVLGYTKMKKQRAAIKIEEPMEPNPPEYVSYRHFSLQSGDRPENNACPSFIGNIGTNSSNT